MKGIEYCEDHWYAKLFMSPYPSPLVTCATHAGLKGEGLRRDISIEEVKQHATRDDAWLVYNGKVRPIQSGMQFMIALWYGSGCVLTD